VAALGCLPPTVEPRATEHIEEMKTLIERLIASAIAYAAEDHVLFSVPSMPDYGRLSKRSLDEMVAGARVDVAPYKRGDMDFVLWKPSRDGEPAGRHPPASSAGASGLAHRMLGDELEASRRDLRHPWRRHRPRVSRTTRTRSRNRAAPSTRA
jgi:cysteinyl-tRNA synthetase